MSVDSEYYHDAGRLLLARSISARARSNVFCLFMREMTPHQDTMILDVDSSDEEGLLLACTRFG